MASSKSLLHIADFAYKMLKNGECGFSTEEEKIIQRNIQYWIDSKHHYEESSGRACIATIYYFTDDIHKAYAPYFRYEELAEEYKRISRNLPDYNFWDFAVTINKMYADHIDVVGKWSRDKETIKRRMTELAVSFLCDDSTNHPTDKIWWYMNS